jgi:hypothetical protein
MPEGISAEEELAALRTEEKYLRTFEYGGVFILSVLTLFAVPPIRNHIVGNKQGFFFSGSTEIEKLADELVESSFILLTMAFIFLIQHFINKNHAMQEAIKNQKTNNRVNELQSEVHELKNEIQQLKEQRISTSSTSATPK